MPFDLQMGYQTMLVCAKSIGLMAAKMGREMRVTEIARAYPLRPQGEAFPIKSMAPPSSSSSSSYYYAHSTWSGDSGVEERADAQEESDALRDLGDQMDALTMGECLAAPSLSGLPPSLHLPCGLAGLSCARLWLLPPPSLSPSRLPPWCGRGRRDQL